MSQKLSLLLAATLLSLPCCKSKDDSGSKETTPEETTGDKAAEPKAAEPKAAEEKVAEPAAATTFTTDDFTAPIPAGYKALGKEQLAGLTEKMGQVIAGVLTKPRAAPDYFVTSLIFTLIASEKREPTEGCAEIAEAMGKATGTKAEAPKLVEFPFGKTCQFEMGDEKQRAIQTIVFAGKKWWTLTCNFDPRDEASPKECNEVLEGFAGK